MDIIFRFQMQLLNFTRCFPCLGSQRNGKVENNVLPLKISQFSWSSEKQTVPCKSTAEEVSFEWLHHRISYTDSKVRTTYKT